MLLTESKTYILWENVGKQLKEANLTATQITDIFNKVEQGVTGAGNNRTMLGKGKDVASSVNKAWEDLKTKIQDSKPIKNVDAKYDQVAEKLKQATGGDQGVMKYVQKYRDFAKKHPVAQGIIYSALIAAAGISGAGVGGAAALGLFKMVDKLLQGEKFSSASYSGAKTGALAYGASKIADYMKGGSSGDAATTGTDASSGDRVVQSRGSSGYNSVNQVPTNPDGTPMTLDQINAVKRAHRLAGGNVDEGISNLATHKLTEAQIERIFIITGLLSSTVIMEGPMDYLKGLASKAKGKLQTFGKNLTTKITSDKLNTIWKKAGSPTDSKSIFNLLVQNNIDPTIAKQVFKSMKIPVPRTTSSGSGGGSGGNYGGGTSGVASGRTGGRTGGAAGKGITTPSVTKNPATKPTTPVQKGGASAFSNMTSTLGGTPPASTKAVNQQPTKSSTGGTVIQTPTGLIHTAKTSATKKPVAKTLQKGGAGAFSNMASTLGGIPNQGTSAIPQSGQQAQTTTPQAKTRTGKTAAPIQQPQQSQQTQKTQPTTSQEKPASFSNAMKTNQPSAVPNVGTYQQAAKLQTGQAKPATPATAQTLPQTTAAPAAKPKRTRKTPAKAAVTESVQNTKGEIMENVDKDIAAMLTSLKKYDKLMESVAPVLERKKPDADGDGVPDWADKHPGEDDSKVEEKAKNPYAIGMAQAMKATGDKPPLKKSTITKAHEIAKAIDEEDTTNPDQEVMEWMERFRKLG